MKQYYYFYVITNLVNGKVYYGVHSTKNLEDGYMGSGKIIQKAILKYGTNNFKKEIWEFFDSEDKMFDYEKQFIDSSVINDRNTYNLNEGGRGSFTYTNKLLSENPELRKQANIKRRRTWSKKDLTNFGFANTSIYDEEWRRKQVKQRKNTIIEKYGSYKNAYGRKISETLKEKWANATEEQRKEHGAKALRGRNPNNVKKFEKGFSNANYKGLNGRYYNNFSYSIIYLSAYTDLPDSVIKTFLNLPINVSIALEYYEYKGLIRIVEKDRLVKYHNGDSAEWCKKTIIVDTTGYKNVLSIKYYLPYKEIFLKYLEFYNDFITIMNNIDYNIPDRYKARYHLDIDYQNDTIQKLIDFYNSIGFIKSTTSIYNRKDLTEEYIIKYNVNPRLKTIKITKIDSFKKCPKWTLHKKEGVIIYE